MKKTLSRTIIFRILAIVLIAMIIFVLIANHLISSWYKEISLETGNRFAHQLSIQLAGIYQTYGNWDDVLLYLDEIELGIKQPNNTTLLNNESGTGQPLKSGGNLGGGQGNLNNPFGGGENVPRIGAPSNININKESILLYDKDGILLFRDDESNLLEGVKFETYQEKMEPIQVTDQTIGYVLVGSTVGILPQAQSILLKRITLLIIMMGVAIGGAIVFVTYFQMKRITLPLKTLSESSFAVAHGDLEQHVQIDSQDEVGQLSTAFNQMVADLKKQQLLRKRTTADIAHELRTPLSVLQIDLESIEDGIIDPDFEVIQRLQYQVSHLGNMIEDLRILSLSDAGELRLEKERINLNIFFSSFINRMKPLGKEKEITFHKNIIAKELYVEGDARRLNQVFINILQNALRHSPEKGKITFELRKHKDNVVISIANDGEGIPSDKLDLIFMRFYRLEEARSRDSGGSGLGLAICKNIVEAHQGEIWAESIKDDSATIFISLPLLAD